MDGVVVPELNETVGDGSDGDDDVPPRPSEVVVDSVGSARDRCGSSRPGLVGPCFFSLVPSGAALLIVSYHELGQTGFRPTLRERAPVPS